ncbi:MAG: serine acetyltransferase [Gammaproteobacteria bacterium]|nr:serine acetyltransferase [Gammaproteobacteria bacterium]|tara:strand:+ start:304 stop:975 length:672 start_codon:yes stop_codon:yes gene_type:complete
MVSSLSKKELVDYIKNLLNRNFPDPYPCDIKSLESIVSDGLDRLEYSFSHVNDRYFNDGVSARFNHLNTDHMVVLIYYIANSGYMKNISENILQKLYCLNKLLHSVDIFYSVRLPKIFCVAHPLGTILGHAEYNDYLYIYQNVTIGSTNDGIYPKLGMHVALSSNTSIIGECNIGNNVLFGGNSFIINTDIPDNSLVLGHYPNNRIVENKTPVFKRFFKEKNE